MYNYNNSIKSEIVPHDIFLALAPTGSHILITPWMVPGLKLSCTPLRVVIQGFESLLGICVDSLRYSSDGWLTSLCAAFIVASDPNVVPRFHSTRSTHLLFIPQDVGMMTPWLHLAKVFVAPHQSLVNCLEIFFNDTKFTWNITKCF